MSREKNEKIFNMCGDTVNLTKKVNELLNYEKISN